MRINQHMIIIDKRCAFGRLNSPSRHPHRKGGDAFVVDRAVMPAPTAGRRTLLIKADIHDVTLQPPANMLL